MKISWFDRIVMAVTPVALLAVGLLTSQAMERPTVTGKHYEVTEDSPLWDCSYHGNRACTPDEVPAMDAVITVSLSGDPLTDCYSLLASAGYADSLAGPMCQLVEENLG